MKRTWIPTLFLASFYACAPGQERSFEESASIEAASQNVAHGITLAMPAEHARRSRTISTFVGRRTQEIANIGPGEPPLPIYLNRYGGTYTPGDDDARVNTSIVPTSRSTLSAFGGGDTAWAQTVACISDLFADFNVVIVETEPASGDYIESAIGGSPSQMGLPSGVGGIAPMDVDGCGIVPNAIVFTFASAVGNDPQQTCEIAGQEIAHALSLDHEYHCPDIMTYLSGCGTKRFRDYASECGEYSSRSCTCNGPRQNSVAVLTTKLGPSSGTMPTPPDPNPPVVAVVAPRSGETLVESSTIEVIADVSDDVGVASVELVWPHSNTTFSCPDAGNNANVTCARVGERNTWSIRIGTGSRAFSVRARDLSGNVTETPQRTIQLGPRALPPPDSTPPSIVVTTPTPGAELPAHSTISISVNAHDESGIASVELVWTDGEGTFGCPTSSDSMTCSNVGDEYTWSLVAGSGTRRFKVRAVDLAGNIAESPEQTFDLMVELPPDPVLDIVAEDNDRPEQAYPLHCASALDLVVSASDEDWFSIEAPEGVLVDVTLRTELEEPIAILLYEADGVTPFPDLEHAVDGGARATATSRGPNVIVRVTTGSNGLAYRLTNLCTDLRPNAPPPEVPAEHEPPQPVLPAAADSPTIMGRVDGCGCSATTSARESGALGSVFVLLALFCRRRRE